MSVLDLYMNYARHDDFPKIWHRYCGMVLVGLATGRRVILPYSRFKMMALLHTVFIGRSGLGKSAVIYMLRDLVLQGLTRKKCEVFSRRGTIAGLLAKIPREDDKMSKPMLVEAGELTTLINKADYQSDMVQSLCDLCDNNYFESNLKSERIVIEDVQISLMLGSNITNMINYLPGNLPQTGLASRLCWVPYDGERPKRDLGADRSEMDLEVQNDKEDLIAGLRRLVDMKGNMELSETARMWLTSWGKSFGEELPEDEAFDGYYNRRHVYILRFAMIHALSNYRMTITHEDMDWGWEECKAMEPGMFDIFYKLMSSSHGRLEDQVFYFIAQHDPKWVTSGDVKQKFHKKMQGSQHVQHLLDSLEEAGLVKGRPIKGRKGRAYRTADSVKAEGADGSTEAAAAE